jgi:hypothetical protein
MVTQSDKKKVGKRVGKLFQSLNKTKLAREVSSRSANQGLPTVVRQRVLSRARLGELEACKGHQETKRETGKPSKQNNRRKKWASKLKSMLFL